VQATKSDSNNAGRLEEAQANYEGHKQNFEKLRSDVSIKLKFLDENRVQPLQIFYKLLFAIQNKLTFNQCTIYSFRLKSCTSNCSYFIMQYLPIFRVIKPRWKLH